VSFDAVEENRRFAEKYGFPFPLLSDGDRRIGLAYEACTSPEDRSAQRITYVIGKTGEIEHAIATKDAGGQAQALLELLGTP
jgi:peroxiredoxin Q/BCP